MVNGRFQRQGQCKGLARHDRYRRGRRRLRDPSAIRARIRRRVSGERAGGQISEEDAGCRASEDPAGNARGSLTDGYRDAVRGGRDKPRALRPLDGE